MFRILITEIGVRMMKKLGFLGKSFRERLICLPPISYYFLRLFNCLQCNLFCMRHCLLYCFKFWLSSKLDITSLKISNFWKTLQEKTRQLIPRHCWGWTEQRNSSEDSATDRSQHPWVPALVPPVTNWVSLSCCLSGTYLNAYCTEQLHAVNEMLSKSKLKTKPPHPNIWY